MATPLLWGESVLFLSCVSACDLSRFNGGRLAERLFTRSCRCEQSLSGTTTVCVEELLYGHALAMGREAAIDEMVGKLHTSRALYQRAKLLLEQLAEEPHVGQADRAVLSKYAAGFAWRLQEIAMAEG